MSEESGVPKIPFKNDGSFLEMFKKMQEAQKKESTASKDEPSTKPVMRPTEEPAEEMRKPKEDAPAPPAFLVGKRKGGKVLPTGSVKKVKPQEPELPKGKLDAMQQYLLEVQKYKNSTCKEDNSGRPVLK